MNVLLYAIAAVLLAAALACHRKICRSSTLEAAAPWLALLAASVIGSAVAVLYAGGRP